MRTAGVSGRNDCCITGDRYDDADSKLAVSNNGDKSTDLVNLTESLTRSFARSFVSLKRFWRAPYRYCGRQGHTNADVNNSFAVEMQEIEDLPMPYPIRPVRQRNGRLSIFPDSVPLPDSGPLGAWVKWLCGAANKGFPPYQRLQPDDLSQKDKNRLPALRFLMDRIEDRTRQLNLNTWVLTLQSHTLREFHFTRKLDIWPNVLTSPLQAQTNGSCDEDNWENHECHCDGTDSLDLQT